jgi:hypothetical protein
MGCRREPVLVIGAGIAGCAAALFLARTGPVVLDAGGDRPSPRPRLVSIPFPLLGLLVELGVHPQALGSDTVARTLVSGWDSGSPRRIETVRKLHCDQRRIEAALRAVVERDCAIRIVDGADEGGFARVIDARGRHGAGPAFRPERPWTARLWQGEAGGGSDMRESFAIAALPDGYAFRLHAGRSWTVGFTSPDPSAPCLAELAERLAEHGRDWLIAGLPRDDAIAGRGGTASVAWAANAPCRVEPVGEALLACDTLASQGIAWAMSDAMHLALPYHERQSRSAEQRRSHLTRLLGTLDTNGFADAPAWRDYRRFVAAHADPLSAPSTTGRSHASAGKVVPMPPASRIGGGPLGFDGQSAERMGIGLRGIAVPHAPAPAVGLIGGGGGPLPGAVEPEAATPLSRGGRRSGRY